MVQNFALHFWKLSAFMHHIKISEILICYMFLHKLKERRQPPNTHQFDLYHPMAHPNTRPISFTYAPMASMWGRYPPQSVSVLGPAPTLSPSFLLAQAIFQPNLFLYKYPNILKLSHSSYLHAYEDGTVFWNVGI